MKSDSLDWEEITNLHTPALVAIAASYGYGHGNALDMMVAMKARNA